MKNGTMINVKKGLGFALAAMSAMSIYTIIPSTLPEIIHVSVMAISAYFLIKSGSRK